MHKICDKGTIVESSGSYSSANASVVVANYSGPSSQRIVYSRPLPTPLPLSLSPWDHLPPSMPLSSSSILLDRKHTTSSTAGGVISGASSLLIPPQTPPSLSSISQNRLSLLTPLLLFPILRDHHISVAAWVVVPKSLPPPSSSLIPWTHFLFLILRWRLQRCRRFRGPVSERLLTFGLLNFYFVWWRFALVTVGRSSLPYLVRYRHRWKQLRCKLNAQIIYE